MDEEEESLLSLLSAENLSMPNVQTIVVRADIRCNHCQERVAVLLSKVQGLENYEVDVTKSEVTMRGRIDLKKRRKTKKHGRCQFLPPILKQGLIHMSKGRRLGNRSFILKGLSYLLSFFNCT
ncbi:uncharacterized protein LOC116266314 [Nymphaea colorata]|nr:uncharacterized protein LOC116266314 [Nymphaea colorata]XP_031503334.1 uncharacterized protein LOC116266314 [Nymphaea colorata]XP_031503335.1 uncharacterized protein LOC116266314 [Nymphaea colorata]